MTLAGWIVTVFLFIAPERVPVAETESTGPVTIGACYYHQGYVGSTDKDDSESGEFYTEGQSYADYGNVFLDILR